VTLIEACIGVAVTVILALLAASAGARSYEGLANGSRTVGAASGYGTPTTYLVTRQIDGLGALQAKTASISVGWADRAGNTQQLAPNSVIAGNDPAYSGALALARSALVMKAFGRSSLIPLTTKDLGNGSSVFKAVSIGSIAFVFDNTTGLLTSRCDSVSAAVATAALRDVPLTLAVSLQLSGPTTGRWRVGIRRSGKPHAGRRRRAHDAGRRQRQRCVRQPGHGAAPALIIRAAMPMPSSHPTPMHEAMALAQHAIGLSEPNPRVGCAITAANGRVIGRGHTQQAGGAHAEVMALRDLQSRGESARGATAYVTLEPCSHHGRTPPCCDALIDAGIARVVIAAQDPNPLVAGQGAARLRAAGVEVETGALAAEARELNIGFFSRMQRGRPWVRLKAAVSLDGRTALNNGTSQWITDALARADGHAYRKRAGAVLTGVGTVQDDDPRLDVRLVETALQPLRVIVDSRLDTPVTARILDAPGSVLIYAASPDAERRAALEARGAQIALAAGLSGKVDLPAMLADLAARGINELHVEAGHKLNGSFVREGLVDEFLIYMAPKLIGIGRELAAFGPLEQLQDSLALHFISVTLIGDDLRLIARPIGRPATIG
jgi:diaminohydroxyphosphoribosylaminopyrimidine deaminase/5-amino-6-(5-phosphoribosylamino)uracil reductase